MRRLHLVRLVALTVAAAALACSNAVFLTAPTDGNAGGDAATRPADSDAGAIGPTVDAGRGCPGVDLLIDRQHCGRCGHDCAGGACLAGVCRPVVLLASRAESASFLVAPDAIYISVYGSTANGGGIHRMLRDPPFTSTRVVVQQGAWQLSMTPERALEWSNWSAVASGGGIWVRAGEATTLRATDNSARSLLRDGPWLFWAGDYRTTVRGLLSTSGAPFVLATEPRADTVGALAADARCVYWTDLVTNAIHSVWKQVGSTIGTTVSGVVRPSGLVVARDDLYFSSAGSADCNGGGHVSRARLNGLCGAATPTLVVADESCVEALVVGADRVYWVNRLPAGRGRIRSAPRAGGEPVTVVDGLDEPEELHLDGTVLYWRTAAGQLGRIALP